MKSYKFNIGGKAYEVTINKAQNGVVDINVNDKNFVVEIEKEKPVVTPPAPAPRPQLIEPKPTVTHKVSSSAFFSVEEDISFLGKNASVFAPMSTK